MKIISSILVGLLTDFIVARIGNIPMRQRLPLSSNFVSQCAGEFYLSFYKQALELKVEVSRHALKEWRIDATRFLKEIAYLKRLQSQLQFSNAVSL